ncbi:MAG: type II secretion system F family protein [Roseburia sp.]
MNFKSKRIEEWVMVICIVVGMVAFLCYWRMHRHEAIKKKMFLCIGAFAFLGAAAQFLQGQEGMLQEDGSIVRNLAGGGEKEAELILEVPELEKEYEMSVDIPEERLTQQEVRQLFELAQKEVDEVFLGKNDSLNHITQDVVLKEKYQEGLVTADWSFDPYNVIEVDGTLRKENLSQEGCLVQAVCKMTYGEYQSEYEFYFEAFLPEQTEEEQLLSGVKVALEEQGAQEETQSFYLPKEINGYLLSWKEKKSNIAYQLLGLGAVFAIGLKISEAEKERRKEKERKMLLEIEYPELVNKLALLLGAGMTLNHAWNRIATSYGKERKKNGKLKKPAYEEMLIACREMQSGVGEKTAYVHFGERCGIRRYRKLASLLTQNTKKGTCGLTHLLEQESEDAFEERKNSAKKYAEEAGTKLLLPMILMLGIVIVIIMVPAALSFQM